MWRFLGFFIGTGLVAVPALMLMGSPKQSLETIIDSSWRSQPETAAAVTAGSNAAVKPAINNMSEATTPAPPTPSAAISPVEKATVADTPDQSPDRQVAENPPEPVQATIEKAEAAVADSQPEPLLLEPPEQIHLLWSPFRNMAAAEGFARRLSRVSGVDVKVAQAEPGRYRVGFDYRDDIHKNWCLGQIQARTGLDLKVPDPAKGDALAAPRESKAAMPLPSTPVGPVDLAVRHI